MPWICLSPPSVGVTVGMVPACLRAGSLLKLMLLLRGGGVGRLVKAADGWATAAATGVDVS